MWSEKEFGNKLCKSSKCLRKNPVAMPARRDSARLKRERLSLGALKLVQPYPSSEPTDFRWASTTFSFGYRSYLLKVEDDNSVEVSLQMTSRALIVSASYLTNITGHHADFRQDPHG